MKGKPNRKYKDAGKTLEPKHWRFIDDMIFTPGNTPLNGDYFKRRAQITRAKMVERGCDRSLSSIMITQAKLFLNYSEKGKRKPPAVQLAQNTKWLDFPSELVKSRPVGDIEKYILSKEYWPRMLKLFSFDDWDHKAIIEYYATLAWIPFDVASDLVVELKLKMPRKEPVKRARIV